MAPTADRPAAASLPALWFGLLGGHVAWTAHLLLSYALVPAACATFGPLLLHLVTGATALGALAATIVAFRAWQQLAGPRDPRTEHQRAARSYLALSGFVLSALFLLAILVEGAAVLIVDPCGPLPWFRPAPL